MTNMNFKGLLIGALFLSFTTACNDDSSTAPKLFTYSVASSWSCDGNFCQDVWELEIKKGTTATFSISDLTDGSIGQIALYEPGVALGGTNLFTDNNNELSCTDLGNCDNGVSGVSKVISITKTGTYKFAATRNNNESCGSTGNYTLTIVSTDKTPVQIADNTASLAPETAECN